MEYNTTTSMPGMSKSRNKSRLGMKYKKSYTHKHNIKLFKQWKGKKGMFYILGITCPMKFLLLQQKYKFERLYGKCLN